MPTSWSSHDTGSGCDVTVKRTALLSFMLGATETSKGPEVAPTGMVMLSDVPLQVLTVTAVPSSSTALPPCEAPGAGAAAELTDTLSNVAVAKEEVVRLLTASPTYTFGAMLTVWLAPNCTQFTPSAELYIVNTFPLLASLIQYGSVPLPKDW